MQDRSDDVSSSPAQPIGWTTRLVIIGLSLFALAEGSYRWLAHAGTAGFTGTIGRLNYAAVRPILTRYLPIRAWTVEHPVLAVALALSTLAVALLLARQWLILWHNHILPRFVGTRFEDHEDTFPVIPVDLLQEIRDRPPGKTFVGRTPRKTFFGWTSDPVYLDARQRSTHSHVMGRTGSGKTVSCLFPQAAQDILDGKGVVLMSGKGSDEEIASIMALAKLAQRERDLLIFSLPAWNTPGIPSHTYNMVYVAPRTPTSHGGDPIATAERVFKVLPMGDNVFYNQQAQIMFRNLCRALHARLDAAGCTIPFNMRDIAACLKGVGNSDAVYSLGLTTVLEETTDREAAAEIRSQQARLGHEIHKVLSGLVGAVDAFLAPLVNSYNPDIIFEKVLGEKRRLPDGTEDTRRAIVYLQLPSNLYKIQAPSLGKVFLMDIQQEGSLRQIYRQQRDQHPFTVIVDEYARFADLSICDSLSQLRDARVEFTIAHQSIADLELVSKEFAASVMDNTRVKIILNQDNPQLCEQIAKSIGTYQDVKLTVPRLPGPLLTSLQSRAASTREVETFKLHPNKIKNLARFGQGWIYTDDLLKPINFGCLPASLTANDVVLTYKDPAAARGQRLTELVAAHVADAERAQRFAQASAPLPPIPTSPAPAPKKPRGKKAAPRSPRKP